MFTKTEIAEAQAAVAAAGADVFMHRAIRRATMADGSRPRQVRTFAVPADCIDCVDVLAHVEFEAMRAEKPGADEYTNTLPPVGLRLDGKVSKGFGTNAEGGVVWAGNRAHKGGEPLPAPKVEAAKA